jgi:hypothetical protein
MLPLTDVAVAMGPRNKRRLTTGSIVVSSVAAIAASALWFFGGLPFVHSADHSGSATPAARHLALIPDGLVYGMTKPQVLRKIGRPERIAGNCWQYHEGVENFVGQTIDAVRVCFVGNTYSTAFYEQIDGLWRDPSGASHVIPPPTQ